MLRLKDLFKIDFSSKGGGKLADKIFNKYNITREEREEVKNEIANGGGGGADSEEIWYEVINPITYHKLSDLLGSDIVVFITGISGFIPNVNFLGINLPSDMVTSETVIYYFNIKGFLYAPDINFEGTYNSIEDLVYLLFKRTGMMNDDEIIAYLTTFYTNFKKVTYSIVLEKFKSLIPA